MRADCSRTLPPQDSRETRGIQFVETSKFLPKIKARDTSSARGRKVFPPPNLKEWTRIPQGNRNALSRGENQDEKQKLLKDRVAG